MVKVKKRDGSLEDFDFNKIYRAIIKSMKFCGNISKKVALHISEYINDLHKSEKEVSISTIETEVFNQLISRGKKDVAKAYEGYRAIREFQRNADTELESQLSTMLSGHNDYWSTENSNKDADLVATKRDYMAGIVSKHIAKKNIFSPEVIQADKEAIIKIHDLDYAAQHLTNCCLINLEDMLQNGTNINGVHIDKPHRILTATTLATQVITSVTSNQYGLSSAV